MTKVDLQLFQASLRVITFELKQLHDDTIPKKVFDELSAMEVVIERDLPNEH